MELLIREGESKDMASVAELFDELAIFENISDASLSFYDLIRDGFSDKPKFQMFVAIDQKKEIIVGFLLFYKAYSIKGKSLVLEDTFVTPEYQNNGIALTLFSKFLEYANQNNVNLLEWTLRDNFLSLRELYLRAGAKILEDIVIYRIFKKELAAITEGNFVLESDFYKIREATVQDMPKVLDLVDELCVYKQIKNTLTAYDLIRDSFGSNSWFKAFVVEIEEEVVGFLIYHKAYSCFYGEAAIIDTVYIQEKYRGLGFAKMLYYGFFKYAYDNNCNRISQKLIDNGEKTIKSAKFFGGRIVEGLKIVNISKEALDKFINN